MSDRYARALDLDLAFLISYQLARFSAKTNGFVIPSNHFWQALSFTIGFVSVRFVYAGHV